jgi:hypothetical protein
MQAGLRAGILAWLTLCLGCAPIGPKTVPRDQFSYNSAIAQSAEEQLLLNLVRLRYSEVPVFLRVSSVISQYSRAGSLQAGGGINSSVSGADTASIGGAVTWADRPTITYEPVSGQEFSRNLLTPIAPRALFEILQSGWPADLVLRIAVWSINGIGGDVARPSVRREASPELYELMDVWRQLRLAGALGVKKQQVKDGDPEVYLFLSESASDPATAPDVARFRELLGLPATASEFHVTYGLVPEKPGDVAVLTGSLWDIMLNLAWQFEVPPAHVASGRTEGAFVPLRGGAPPPIRVRFSEDEPENAFALVREHDHWFYIEENDRHSKRVFSFLQLLLNLSETSNETSAPLVTISP